MLIGEAIADDFANELVNKMQDHVRDLPDLVSHSILAEEGGRMVVLVTDWSCRQCCLQYHASREYRKLMVASQHLLVGSYIVKLFQNKTERRSL
jgi:hypothetical protein